VDTKINIQFIHQEEEKTLAVQDKDGKTESEQEDFLCIDVEMMMSVLVVMMATKCRKTRDLRVQYH
jgi:hypothetical protein